MIPYGRQLIEDDDIESVVEVLRSPWLTTGPKVDEFEEAFAKAVGAKYAVAVNSGTAALHSSMYALAIGAGDEVIVPAMTFAATANCIVFQGGTPIFADVDAATLLIDPCSVEERITQNTKAIVCVDYAGHPCDYDILRAIAERHGLALVADACHSLGGSYKNKAVGSLADLSAFSFHPVKQITTGEGGMVTTNDPKLAERVRLFRNHGIMSDFRARERMGTWEYEMIDLGYNLRITDIQCALGISQLRKLSRFIKRRQQIAEEYDASFKNAGTVSPLSRRQEVVHAYHLYVLKINSLRSEHGRISFFRKAREHGIGVNAHYKPVYLHPFYQNNYNIKPGNCPVAEAAYGKIFSMPIFPAMTEEEVRTVIEVILELT